MPNNSSTVVLGNLECSYPTPQRTTFALRDPLVWLIAGLSLTAMGLVATLAAAAPPTPLTLKLTGFDHDAGHVIVKLFRPGDGAPRGEGYRKATKTISHGTATVNFGGVPNGTYAVFAFHDENANGTLDHNLFGIPSEPYGFSTNFRPSIWSGVPTFDDFKFAFDSETKALTIVVD